MKGSDKFIEDIAGGQSEYSGETESLCYNAKKKSQYYGIEFQKTHNTKLYEVYPSASRRVAGIFCAAKWSERYTIFELSRRNRRCFPAQSVSMLVYLHRRFRLGKPAHKLRMPACRCVAGTNTVVL